MKRVELPLSNMIYSITMLILAHCAIKRYQIYEVARYGMRSISIVSLTMLDIKKKPPQFFKKDFCVEF